MRRCNEEFTLREAMGRMDEILDSLEDGKTTKEAAKEAVRNVYREAVKHMGWQDRLGTLWSEAVATLIDIDAMAV